MIDPLLSLAYSTLLYSMGIAALANANFSTLVSILSKNVAARRGHRQHFLTVLDWPELQQWFKQLDEWKQKYYPASEWLFANCRQPLKTLIASDAEYERLFDIFEVLRSLVYIDLERGGNYRPDLTEVWGPPGRFVWKLASRGENDNYLEMVKNDKAIVEGVVSTGLFGGSVDTFRSVVDKFAPMVAKFAADKW